MVLGGGVTGTAIARDLAIRGLEITLVERGRLTDGATGRMQGLLYSGARYADAGQPVATNCCDENRTLAEIADHCVEETGGLLVPTDADEATVESIVEACEDCDIPAEALTGEKARSMEPALDEGVEGAVRVPDATVDPFRLTVATAKSAIAFGTEIRTHTEVTDIHVEDGAVTAVTVERDPEPTGRPHPEDSEGATADSTSPDGDDPDTVPDGGKQVPGASGGPGAVPSGETDVPGMPGTTGEERPSRPTAETERLEPDYVVNATGAWADEVAGLAGFSFPMHRSRGAMVVTEDQPVGMPVSLGATPGPVRTVVPHGQHAVVGATNDPVADPDDLDGDGDDADRVLADLTGVVPALDDSRLLRTFWGVRSGPPRGDGEGRRFALVDHADRDGCWGMTTVVGGTLTIHRLVAERVADHVCGTFGISRECKTDELPLPGSEDQEVLDAVMDTFGLSSPVYDRTRERLGSRTPEVLDTDGPNPVLCEAESVTRAEVRDALDDASAAAVDLNDIRIRTSATMGACQGGRCAHRIAAELHPEYELDVIEDALDDLLAERWKGQRHALWGDQLAQAARNYDFHASTLGRKYRFEVAETDDSGEAVSGDDSDDDTDADEDEASDEEDGEDADSGGIALDGFDDGPVTGGADQPTVGWGMRR